MPATAPTAQAAQIIVIRPDLHNEQAGFFRAYQTASLDAPTCCTVIGYCSAGGSQRTMAACIRELRRLGLRAGVKCYSEQSGRLLGTV